MRNPKEIENTEYNEFYKKTFNEFLDPLAHTHFTTEVCVNSVNNSVKHLNSHTLYIVNNFIFAINRVRWNSGVFFMFQAWHHLVTRR